MILLSAFLSLGTSLAAADTRSDSRFGWSSNRLAAECGYKSEAYISADRQWFSDRNYSNKWYETSSEKLKACSDCYRVADVARLRGGVRLARVTRTSESGDWFHELTYCFDGAGKLRGVGAIFNCAWGWSFVRVLTFDQDRLKVLESRWQDLKSGKEIARPDTAEEMKELWSDIPVYKVFSELPFAKLMRN
jgi:hypothetical protein